MKIDQAFCRRLHRVAYLSVAGVDGVDGIDPDTESDNLATPASFIAGEPLTEAPTQFGMPKGGPLGLLQNRWRKEAAELKKRWDSHFILLGIRPLQSSVERWGGAYHTPGF
ncbi:hypothetical protein [Anatilimnocola floriformis]|uniref:hypothetical protein n=1 Tax=Anatilimnocola floriformis TaxID=2948575 RepID=UPI0020C32F51|nr:hypothetical protein [Anatilimnocola floriformis]